MSETSRPSADLLEMLANFVAHLEASAGNSRESLDTLLEETEKLLACCTKENAENAIALVRFIEQVARGMKQGEYPKQEATSQTLRHCADYLPQIRERLANENDRALSIQDDTFIEWLKDDLAPHRVETTSQASQTPAETPPSSAKVAVAQAPNKKAEPSAKSPSASTPTTKQTVAPVKKEAPAVSEKVAEAKSADSSNSVTETIRVDIERLDHLMNLSGELVINKARFAQVAHAMRNRFQDKRIRSAVDSFSDRLNHLKQSLLQSEGNGRLEDLARQINLLSDTMEDIEQSLARISEGRAYFSSMSEAIHQLSRLSESIQKSIMSTRMVPIGPLFAKFKRVVRDMATASGKQVNLEIVGEQTELDKRMIDALGDPLIHLIRNSVDHGLEPPADRETKGKPTTGTVRLEAAYAGNCVVVSIGDDGRGLSLEKIGQKAIDRGLTTPQEIALMSDRQIAAFIWQPGFSTAEKVSDISGRGVGMDIVRRKIDELGGSVDLQSSPGQGTTFVIRLPLTLAIMQSLLARVGDVVYAVPLENVAEIVTVNKSNIFQVGGKPVVNIRGDVRELLALSDIFWWGDPNQAVPKADLASEGQAAVILQSAGSRAALLVDYLIGEEEIVIKSLAENLHQIRGLSGASILGDGTVALILDVRSLLELAVDPATVRRRELQVVTK
ncbi:chemotaxis protein CheW [bacterium]|nr:chemotaxis protein CheW [bacterium]